MFSVMKTASPFCRASGTPPPSGYTSNCALTGDLPRIGAAEARLAGRRDGRVRVGLAGIDPSEDDVVARLEACIAARIEHAHTAEAGPRRPVGGPERGGPAVRLRVGDEHDRP